MRRSLACAARLFPAALLVAAAGSSAPLPVTPGTWQTVFRITDIQAQGLPPGVLGAMKQAQTMRYCITPEQAKRGPAAALMQQKGCALTTFDWQPNGHFTTRMTCHRGASVETVTDVGVYTAASFSATGTAVQTGGPMPMTLRLVMAGKRVGGC